MSGCNDNKQLLMDLPSEMVIEIFKFIDNWSFLLTLGQVCKSWRNIFNDNDNGFCKFLYESYFSWRNDPSVKFIEYYKLLQKEIKFWNSWTFLDIPKVFSTIKTKRKGQHIIEIERLQVGDYKNYIDQPILFNTGVYYFEIKTLKDHQRSDNIFVGFILKGLQETYESMYNYLGNENSNSFGFFFCNGDIYGFINKKSWQNYAYEHTPTFRKVGVYLDTNNLKIRFVWVKENKLFELLDLSNFFSEKDLTDFRKGKLALFPGISILHQHSTLELNCTAGFRSIKKANFIKELGK